MDPTGRGALELALAASGGAVFSVSCPVCSSGWEGDGRADLGFRKAGTFSDGEDHLSLWWSSVYPGGTGVREVACSGLFFPHPLPDPMETAGRGGWIGGAGRAMYGTDPSEGCGERRSLLSGFPLLRTGRPGAVELRRSGGIKLISAGEALPDLPGERNRASKTETDGGRSVWRYCLYYPISGLRSFRYLSAGIWSEPYLFGSDRGMVDLIRKSAGEL